MNVNAGALFSPLSWFVRKQLLILRLGSSPYTEAETEIAYLTLTMLSSDSVSVLPLDACGTHGRRFAYIYAHFEVQVHYDKYELWRKTVRTHGIRTILCVRTVDK